MIWDRAGNIWTYDGERMRKNDPDVVASWLETEMQNSIIDALNATPKPGATWGQSDLPGWWLEEVRKAISGAMAACPNS